MQTTGCAHGSSDWNDRAQRYDALGWVHRKDLLAWVVGHVEAEVRRVSALRGSCVVLEAGCGTGALTAELRRLQTKGIGLQRLVAFDPSEEMVLRCRERLRDHAETLTAPAPEVLRGTTKPPDLHPDILVSRMVLHHTDSPPAACAGWLRQVSPGGSVIVAEGPPPVVDPEHPAWGFYRVALGMKEPGRRVFSAGDVAEWLLDAGAAEVSLHEVYTHGNSLRNWLDNSGGMPENIAAIAALHACALHGDGPDWQAVREAYRMEGTPDGDILMRWRHCVVVGRAP